MWEKVLTWLSLPTFVGLIWVVANYVFSTRHRISRIETSQTNLRKTIALQMRNYGEIFS